MKVQFDGEPHLRPIGSDDMWVLDAPFSAKVFAGSNEARWITVPAGFITDLASVPRLPGAYLLFGGRARRAALLHDYLYASQAGKDFADDVFHAAMKAEGVGLFTRSVMFAAVHWFGGQIYDGKSPSAGAPAVTTDDGE